MTETQTPLTEEARSVAAPPPVMAPQGAPTGGAQPARPLSDERPPPRWPRPEEERRERTIQIRIPHVPWARVVGLSLTGVGALILLFLVYLFLFTPVTASRNQQRLAHSLSEQPLAVFSLVAGHVPPDGSPVAVLHIPALQLRQVVVEGTSAADLMNGPGLLAGSALPGSPGNAVIAGRRVTFGAPFGSLPQLRKGDRLEVVDGAGTFTYKVTRMFTIGAGQRDVVTPTLKNRLTLVTSDSTLVTSGRFVVQGTLVGRAVAVPSNIIAVPTYDLGLSGDPVAGGLAILWCLLSLLVIAVAVIVAWRSKKPWIVYLFAAPVFLACGLFVCESLARAMPATF
jgi:sortase A